LRGRRAKSKTGVLLSLTGADKQPPMPSLSRVRVYGTLQILYNTKMDEKLKEAIKKMMEKQKNPSIDILNEQFAIIQDEYNNTGQDRFDGLSPEQMRGLLYEKWGKNLITVNPDKLDGNDIPIIRQIKYFITIVSERLEIKLTQAGYLPPAIVKDIYNQHYITDKHIESGVNKLTKETDVNHIVLTRMLCRAAGLIKVQNNKISVTKKALKIINSPDLFEYLFEITCNKYNWAYFDLFINEKIGQVGYNYTLYLLNKYGDNWKPAGYYADLYFKAFDSFKDEDEYFMLQSCYKYRTFNQILNYYGLIEYENKKTETGNVRKTASFDKYIKTGL
jgi:hypothetical protein